MPAFSDGFLGVPARPGKPREPGLTHVIDKGLNLREIEGMFDTAGEYVDIVKLGWGTCYVTNNLEKKIALYRHYETPVVCGGTLFEAVYARDRIDEFKRWLTSTGFSHVEISDGTIEIPRERKLELIADFARDFTVLSEVGSKDAEVVFAPYQWVEWIKEELEAGAWKVITEGREGGTAGHLPRRPARCAPGCRRDRARDRRPRPDLRGADEGLAGLVRPALRARGQPRQHPARRGDPARDAAPRPARRHPQGGARLATAEPAALPDLDFEAMSAEDVHPLGVRGVRRPALPHLLVAEAVVGARAHGRELGLADRRDRARHAPLLPRDATRRATGSSSATASSSIRAADPDGRRAAPRTEGRTSGSAIPTAAATSARSSRCSQALEPYDAWISGIRRDQSPSRADTPKVEWSERYGVCQGPPARRLGREARLGVHRRQRDSLQPAARRRLPLDRLHPLHPADRDRTRRSAPAAGPARTSSSAASTCERTHDGAHLRARAPESEQRAETAASPSGSPVCPGAGKTTIAHLVGPELERRGLVVEYLDGDVVRTHLSKGLGFSKEDRDTNIERIGWVASRLTRHGGAVIVAAISPYEETRAKAREMVEEFGAVRRGASSRASVDECARRDVKGLYAKAFAGEIKELHRRRRSVRGAGRPPSSWSTPRRTSPRRARGSSSRKLEELGLVRPRWPRERRARRST